MACRQNKELPREAVNESPIWQGNNLQNTLGRSVTRMTSHTQADAWFSSASDVPCWSSSVAIVQTYASFIASSSSRISWTVNRTEHHETIELLCWFYRPITYLGEQCGPFQMVMDHYAWLWG